jgi:5'-3' exonuclease
MGIPSYFSHIVKNYGNMLFSLKHHRKIGTTFDNLYMDCNSIIYDSYHQMMKEPNNSFDENKLIQLVIHKIDEYIRIINPTNCAYIAFDGVAPVAKMKQQRTRRYKSWYMSKITPEVQTPSQNPWNTSYITPGTAFMHKLSLDINNAFRNTETKYGLKQVMVSASNEPGEGEHKMFQHIRNHVKPNENVSVYGLDADLIMLSIFHYHLCKNIHVFRETPEFVKSKVIDGGNNDDILFMDIASLSASILEEMNCKYKDAHQIYDYAFMCFLLGNDFLPHFPSLNIRTHGIQVLLDTYRECIGNVPDAFFISKTTGNIQWKWFQKYIKALASNEHELLIQEYERRNKFDTYTWNASDNEKLIHNAPIISRGIEKYICPTEQGWEDRYYMSLFQLQREKTKTHVHVQNMVKTDDNKKRICKNYLEGLEWVFKYYTEGCVHWKWKYNYNYPPLLSDLMKHVPACEKTLIQPSFESNKPFSAKAQLIYVIPPALHDEILGNDIANYLKKNYTHIYSEKFEFEWAFCRYMWESHLKTDMRMEIVDVCDRVFTNTK